MTNPTTSTALPVIEQFAGQWYLDGQPVTVAALLAALKGE